MPSMTTRWRKKNFDRQYALQGGRCGICHRECKEMMADHCHRLKLVRGLLCGRCNTAIGMFSDDIELMSLAIEYLKPFQDLIDARIKGLKEPFPS